MLPCTAINFRNERWCVSVATSCSPAQCPRWLINGTSSIIFKPKGGYYYANKNIFSRVYGKAGLDDSCGGEDDNAANEDRRSLERLIENPVISGSELRQLVFKKWNREYDVRLTRRGRRMYLQVFWKYLGQKSFPLTEEEYQLQLDAVAEYLSAWGVAGTVRSGIAAAKWAPGPTIGGGARAYSIPLGVDVGSNGRSKEWNTL